MNRTELIRFLQCIDDRALADTYEQQQAGRDYERAQTVPAGFFSEQKPRRKKQRVDDQVTLTRRRKKTSGSGHWASRLSFACEALLRDGSKLGTANSATFPRRACCRSRPGSLTLLLVLPARSHRARRASLRDLLAPVPFLRCYYQ